jgi:hypothetical protein
MNSEMEYRLAIWEAALSEPIGLGLMVSDVLACKMALYQVRIKAQNPALYALQIRTPPESLANEFNLIIVHEKSSPKPNDSYGRIPLEGVLELDGLDV